jgi:hypothetical protein
MTGVSKPVKPSPIGTLPTGTICRNRWREVDRHHAVAKRRKAFSAQEAHDTSGIVVLDQWVTSLAWRRVSKGLKYAVEIRLKL